MTNNTITVILCLAAAFSVACSKPEPQPTPVAVEAPPPVPVCTLAQAQSELQAKYQGFESKVHLGASSVELSKVLKGADGQKLGIETHVFTIKDNQGACEFVECESSREVNGRKLVNNFCQRTSQFYENGRLVYEDSALENGCWLRKYAALNQVPVEAPNWASPDGLSLYMTWIVREGEKASRVPVWGVQAIWIKEGDDFTLLAGEVLLKNPTRTPTSEEVVTFLRTNAQGEVTSNGVLYPVSKATFLAYLTYLKDKAGTWERDRPADEAAMLAFFEGPVKHSRVRAVPIARVFAMRGTQSSRLPTVGPEFVPGFDLVPKLR